MDNEKMNNGFDEFFKKKMENIPEAKPTEEEWQQLRSGLQKEGLLKAASNGRKYFLLLLLALVVGGSISVPLLMNRYSIDFSELSSKNNSGVKNNLTSNKAKEKSPAVFGGNNETSA